eukprot:CAMPEP_0177699118 /NCGR_PEP_ID=MMETSP0484_2-20121128/5417_1 /TAXON_ID=354590 /ORGANISM="Rhodomonas lens, Strain RHODO" /LENGTH=298 /DNA_ID=CAMNT_0019210283 /DNA_START=140 /DNA_END=1036 /DNA_ORIENTATION=+
MVALPPDSTLPERIANFYDQSSPLWEEIWGEHMHMGHYGDKGDEEKTDVQAQIDMIDRVLEWGEVTAPTRVLDVGCGVGGSSRHIARKFPDAQITGVTLSPTQCESAQKRSEAVGLADRTNFQVADALKLPFEDATFDLLWSLESGEHMPRKEEWLTECLRVLKPGGRLLIATWTHKDTAELSCGHRVNPGLTDKDKKLLDKVCKYYHLPEWVSTADYKAIAEKLKFANIKTADWSPSVVPFWPAVWRSALSWRGVKGLIKTISTGWETLRGARAVRYMVKGFNQGLIRLGLITMIKP